MKIKGKPVLAWAIVCRNDRVPAEARGLPIISERKPTQFDKRFYRRARVEIREVHP